MPPFSYSHSHTLHARLIYDGGNNISCTRVRARGMCAAAALPLGILRYVREIFYATKLERDLF